MAYKVFSNGDALTGSELNTYLMNQSVMVFASTTARDAALTAPTEGMVVWLQDSDKYVYYTGSAWADLITPASSGNAIINGAFDIWQRGTSFAGNGVGVYTADRWYYNADGSGSTRSISQQTFTPGTAPVSGYEGQFYCRYSQSVAGTGGTYNEIAQRIEDVRTFAGQTITVSFWAKSDATRTITPYIVQNFGSGGSTGIANIQSVITTSTSWTRYSFTYAVASVSGKTIGTGSSIELRFAFASNAVQTIDIWGVQLEAGSVATSFKRNAPSIQAELAACQRYYQVSSTAAGACQTSTQAYLWEALKVQMRTAPTVTLPGTLTNVIQAMGVGPKTPTSISAEAYTSDQIVFTVGGFSSTSMATGNPVRWNATGIPVSAEL